MTTNECAATPCGAGQACEDLTPAAGDYTCLCYVDPLNVTLGVRGETITFLAPADCSGGSGGGGGGRLSSHSAAVVGIAVGASACAFVVLLYLWMQRRWRGRAGRATYGADEKDADEWTTAAASGVIVPIQGEGDEITHTFTVSRVTANEFEGGRFANKKCDLTLFRVKKDSPFGRAGIEPGMRVVKINGRPVASKREMKRAAEGLAHFRVTVALRALPGDGSHIHLGGGPPSPAGGRPSAPAAPPPEVTTVEKECEELRAALAALRKKCDNPTPPPAAAPIRGASDAGAQPPRAARVDSVVSVSTAGLTESPFRDADPLRSAQQEAALRRQALQLFFSATDEAAPEAVVRASARNNGVDQPFKPVRAKHAVKGGAHGRAVLRLPGQRNGGAGGAFMHVKPGVVRGGRVDVSGVSGGTNENLLSYLEGLQPPPPPQPPAPARKVRVAPPFGADGDAARAPLVHAHASDISIYAHDLLDGQEAELERMLASVRLADSDSESCSRSEDCSDGGGRAAPAAPSGEVSAPARGGGGLGPLGGTGGGSAGAPLLRRPLVRPPDIAIRLREDAIAPTGDAVRSGGLARDLLATGVPVPPATAPPPPLPACKGLLRAQLKLQRVAATAPPARTEML